VVVRVPVHARRRSDVDLLRPGRRRSGGGHGFRSGPARGDDGRAL